MEKDYSKDAGIKALIKKYKKSFQIPENLNHYSQKDYKKAERAFIKQALIDGEFSALYLQPYDSENLKEFL